MSVSDTGCSTGVRLGHSTSLTLSASVAFYSLKFNHLYLSTLGCSPNPTSRVQKARTGSFTEKDPRSTGVEIWIEQFNRGLNRADAVVSGCIPSCGSSDHDDANVCVSPLGPSASNFWSIGWGADYYYAEYRNCKNDRDDEHGDNTDGEEFCELKYFGYEWYWE